MFQDQAYPFAIDHRLNLYYQPAGWNTPEPCLGLAQPLETIECPCCHGYGEHAMGAGPEVTDYPCNTCGGEGRMGLVRIQRKPKVKSQPLAVPQAA